MPQVAPVAPAHEARSARCARSVEGTVRCERDGNSCQQDRDEGARRGALRALERCRTRGADREPSPCAVPELGASTRESARDLRPCSATADGESRDCWLHGWSPEVSEFSRSFARARRSRGDLRLLCRIAPTTNVDRRPTSRAGFHAEPFARARVDPDLAELGMPCATRFRC